MRRRLLRFGMLAIALLAAVAGGLACWANSDDARRRFERLASQTLGREVRVDRLDPGWGSLTLHGLTLADPWSEAPTLSVERASLEVDVAGLARGGLVGTLRAEDFALAVIKRGDTTNLHGIRRPRSSGRPLDLALDLSGGGVTLVDEEQGTTVTLEDMSMSGRVQRADAQPSVALEIAAASVRGEGIEVHDVSASLGLGAEQARLEDVRMRFGEGLVQGHAQVGLVGRNRWSATLRADRVGLGEGLLPVVVAVFPAAAGLQSAPEGEIAGTISLRAQVRGEGFSLSRVRRSAAGQLSVRLEDVTLPKETAAVRIASLLGRPATPMRLSPLDVEARLRGPWVEVEEVRSDGQPVPLPFHGRVGLDGRLDLEVDVLPLLGLASWTHDVAGGHRVRAPIRLEGTTDAPIVRPPSAGALARSLGAALLEHAPRTP